jgi:Sec-independent protein translocase protein TatA
MTIVDAFKGFKEGFASSGGSIIGGVLGAVSGILVGLIGMPLDLLKGIIGWILGKFGMENAKEMLASFSFSDMIKSLFHGITDRVLGLFDAMKDETGKFDFGKIVMTILGVFVNTITAPFRLMLEGLAMLAAKIPVKGKDIAAGIRAFADNITMDTGQKETEARKGDRKQYEANEEEKKRVGKLNNQSGDKMKSGSEEMSGRKGGGSNINVDNSTSNKGGNNSKAGDSFHGDMSGSSDDSPNYE